MTIAPQTRADRRTRTQTLLTELAATTDPGGRARLRDELVRLNLDVADSVVSRYRNRGIDVDDLTQVARLGLVKAIDGYDVDAGFAFLAYAVPTIRGEVTRYFRDSGWAIRPPRSIQELQPRIGAAREELTQRLGRSPRPSDIAEHLGVHLDDVVDAMGADGCFTASSLDTPVGPDQVPLTERLTDDDTSMDAAEARLVLEPVLTKLQPRDRQILHLRYVGGLRQREIGERFGISQMQVSRILTRVLNELREELEPAS